MQFSLFEAGMGTVTAMFTVVAVMVVHLLHTVKAFDALMRFFGHLQKLQGAAPSKGRKR